MADPVRESIRDRALACGFDAVGFAEARLAEGARAGLGEFIARGYHGDMGWLAGTAARRGDPQALWPEARTVVVLGISYAPEEGPLALAREPDRGVVSIYARGRDYHDTLKRRLKTHAHWIDEQWPGALKLFVDTAPVMEKPLAQCAGLGWQGKHTNLVSRRNLFAPRTRTRCCGIRPLRFMPALSRRLPDRGLPGALSARCATLHLLPDDRAQ